MSSCQDRPAVASAQVSALRAARGLVLMGSLAAVPASDALAWAQVALAWVQDAVRWVQDAVWLAALV